MNIMNHPFDVVVIGAGQAGLACGWHLKQQGVDFLILDEQQQPGGNWRNYYDIVPGQQLWQSLAIDSNSCLMVCNRANFASTDSRCFLTTDNASPQERC